MRTQSRTRVHVHVYGLVEVGGCKRSVTVRGPGLGNTLELKSVLARQIVRVYMVSSAYIPPYENLSGEYRRINSSQTHITFSPERESLSQATPHSTCNFPTLTRSLTYNIVRRYNGKRKREILDSTFGVISAFPINNKLIVELTSLSLSLSLSLCLFLFLFL